MDERRAIGLALLAVFFWSTVATAFKLTLAELTPIQMVTAACIVSASALLLICAFQRKLHLLSNTFMANPGYFILLGVINPLAYHLILFKAYSLLPASQAQTINYSWAITLTLMAALFLGQKIRKQDWAACLLSYSGVIVIATQGNILSLNFQSPAGVALALFSTLLWATYWILNTRSQADPVIGVLLGFLVAVPLALALSWYEGANWSLITWKGWAAVTYVGLFEMGVTFVLWVSALKLTRNTSRISNLIFISPFVSLLLLATIIGEEIHPSTLAGLILIISGLIVQQLKKKPAKKAPSCG